MFLVADAPNPRRQAAALILTFGGGVAVAFALFARLPVLFLFPIPIAGLALQIVCLSQMLKSRRRRGIEPPFRFAISAYLDLSLAAIVGLLLASGVAHGTALNVRLMAVYVFLLLFGFLLQTVVGILSKILAFLVWHRVYARRIGLSPVPLLRELSPERLLEVGFLMFRIASLAMASAILAGQAAWLSIAALSLTASLVPIFLNAARVLSHLRRSPTKEVPHADAVPAH